MGKPGVRYNELGVDMKKTAVKKIKKLSKMGRFGDTKLAHINPREEAMLKQAGGLGTTNPSTGLPEFFGFGDILSAVAPIAIGAMTGNPMAAMGGMGGGKAGGSMIAPILSGIMGGVSGANKNKHADNLPNVERDEQLPWRTKGGVSLLSDQGGFNPAGLFLSLAASNLMGGGKKHDDEFKQPSYIDMAFDPSSLRNATIFDKSGNAGQGIGATFNKERGYASGGQVKGYAEGGEVWNEEAATRIGRMLGLLQPNESATGGLLASRVASSAPQMQEQFNQVKQGYIKDPSAFGGPKTAATGTTAASGAPAAPQADPNDPYASLSNIQLSPNHEGQYFFNPNNNQVVDRKTGQQMLLGGTFAPAKGMDIRPGYVYDMNGKPLFKAGNPDVGAANDALHNPMLTTQQVLKAQTKAYDDYKYPQTATGPVANAVGTSSTQNAAGNSSAGASGGTGSGATSGTSSSSGSVFNDPTALNGGKQIHMDPRNQAEIDARAKGYQGQFGGGGYTGYLAGLSDSWGNANNVSANTTGVNSSGGLVAPGGTTGSGGGSGSTLGYGGFASTPGGNQPARNPWETYGMGPMINFFPNRDTGTAPVQKKAGGKIKAKKKLKSRVDMRAAGGPISGPGGGKDDLIPAMLSDGEHVITADEVSDLGDGSNEEGHKRLYKFRENLRTHKNKAKPTGHRPKAKRVEAYMKKGKK